jgi:3'-5' exoribonuclease
MNRLPVIARFEPTTAGWGFLLCTDKALRTGRGGDYLALTLRDATGEIPGRVFENLDRLRDEFDAGEFVKVQGRVTQFNGRLQLHLDTIRRVLPDQDRAAGFSEESLLPSAARPIGEMWAELQRIVDTVTPPPLRTLLDHVLRTHEAQLRSWPAGRTVHHAYRGGLLEHVLTMAEAGRALARIYGASADLVVAGAILHDLGKLRELDYDAGARYTRDGNLIGHIALGVRLLDEACRVVPDLPESLVSELTHLIVSHHGEKALGSPVEPMTAEAFILAAVDTLDARLEQVRRAVREDPGDDEFTAYQPRLGRLLWKGPSA